MLLVTDDVIETGAKRDPAFLHDVVTGLSQTVKAIPARWFYDRRGSELFEAITAVPEYYPTWTEQVLLQRHAADVARIVGPHRAVVEFGAGSAVKTPTLLHAVSPAAYVPIDISADFLALSAGGLSSQFPHLAVLPVAGDFTTNLRLPGAIAELGKLGFFPGSTIGNFVPRTAVDLLRAFGRTLGEGAMLLIGIDRVKDQRLLERAYDDASGVTRDFNLNLLVRINRELGGTIDVERFGHEARWNASESRIEMHLVARDDMHFEVADRVFSVVKGESIHTENSYKYTRASAQLLLAAAGWSVEQNWCDDGDQFALILARARRTPDAP